MIAKDTKKDIKRETEKRKERDRTVNQRRGEDTAVREKRQRERESSLSLLGELTDAFSSLAVGR